MNGTRGGFMPLLGRIFISLIFILSAFNKLGNFGGTAGYMAANGMPAVGFFLVTAIFFELVGGLLVLSGFKSHIGAVMLMIFIVPATLIFHDFWTYSGMDRQMQMIHFLKNLAILGGLVVLAGAGPGPISVGVKRR